MNTTRTNRTRADRLRTEEVRAQREADRKYIEENRGRITIPGVGPIDPVWLAGRMSELRHIGLALRTVKDRGLDAAIVTEIRKEYQSAIAAFWRLLEGLSAKELLWQAIDTATYLTWIRWSDLLRLWQAALAANQQAAQTEQAGEVAVGEFPVKEAGRVIGHIRWSAADGYSAYSRRTGVLGAAESYDEAETLVREAERLHTVDAVICQIGGLVFDVRLPRRKKWLRELDANEVAALVRGSVFVFSGSVHPHAKNLIRDLVSQRRPEDLGGCVVLARPKPSRSGGGARAIVAELALA